MPSPTSNPRPHRDVLIAGGGPAGLATAIFAARAGLRVTLVEQRRLPADKACGEGLMPAGVALLDDMAVRVARSRPFEGIRYIDGKRVLEARFSGRSGLGVRRYELSRALLSKAQELGAEVLDGTKVEGARVESDRVVLATSAGSICARWLVAADGLRSPLRQAFGLEAAPRPGRTRVERYGFRQHFRCSPWTSFVEVHWSDGAEAYVTPVAGDEVGIAVLWHGERPPREDWVSRFPRLARTLGGAEVVSTVRGAGPFRQAALRVTTGRLALVGDAAGYVDALTGEGIALGFRSARALARSLANEGLEAYERAYWRLSRRYRASTEIVVSMAVSPRVRRLALRALAGRADLFERLLRWMS